MAKKKHKTQNQSQPTKSKKGSTNSLAFIKEALTLIGGLAGSVLAVYGLVKTFRDDTEGFSWLIPVGIVIWLIILWRLFQVRKTTAYSLFIISVIAGGAGWIGWQSKIEANEDKLIVLVAQFDGPEEDYHLRDEILKQLRLTTKNYPDTEIIPFEKVITEVQGSEYARKVGREKKADLVIWGWYTKTESSNLNLYIENLSSYQFVDLEDTRLYQPQVALSDLETLKMQKQIGTKLSDLVAFLSGYISYRSNDYVTAVKRFDQALTSRESEAFIKQEDVLFLIANCHFYLNQYESAITDFDKIIQAKPDYVIALSNRGYIYALLGDYDRALADLDHAILIEPNYASAYINRGLTFGLQGQFDQAISDFNYVLQIEPNSADAYGNRGNAYLGKNEFNLAISDYDNALRINPDFVPFYNNRGAAYAQLGQYERAIQDYSKAIELNPDFAVAYRNRSNAYQSLGKTAEAEADFKKYEELSGQKP